MKLQIRNSIRSKKYYFNSYIILIIIGASYPAFSNNNGNSGPSTTGRCPGSFTDPSSDLETRIYELADAAYQIRQRAANLFHTSKEKKERWIRDLEGLENHLLKYLENDRIKELDPEKIEDLLKQREWQIEQEEISAHTPSTTPKPNGKDINWDTLVEDPTLIQPNHPYSLLFTNNTFNHHIIFLPRVVTKFFNREKGYDEKLARKFLITIRKGFINNRDSEHLSGIKRLDLNSSNRQNDIIEVKTIGDISGHIRLGGFLIGNTIYITDFSKASNHNRITTERFAQRLLQQLNAHLESQVSTSSHF